MFLYSFNTADTDEQNPVESITSAMISVAEAVNNQKSFLPKVSPLLNTIYQCLLDTAQKRSFLGLRHHLSRCSTL